MSSKEQTQSNDKAGSKQRLPKPDTENLDILAQQQTHPATIIQRAGRDPSSLTPRDVLQLQRTIGNQPLQRLLAREAVVSAPVPAGAVIQRRGTYKPIDIRQAVDVNAIEEQEYGSGTTVKLTSITSCVGFLARAGTQVYGLHLGMLDANGVNVSTINLNELVEAIQVIWPATDAVYQVGMADNWQRKVLQPVYNIVLNAAEMDADLNKAGHIYSAAINSQNKLAVSRDNQVIWTEP
jgi:hypothetical protein